MNPSLGVGIIRGSQQVSTIQEMPAIPSALVEQEKSLINLSETISNLETRLDPILRKEPSDVCDKNMTEPPPSGVSDTIRRGNNAIARINGRVSELLRLLEV